LMRYVLPQNLIKAAISGEPYPLKAFFLQGASLLHTYPNAKETYQVLKNLDFSVATDFFMTPTAELVDIVLPVASYLEFDGIHVSDYMDVASVIRKVAQVGECRPDHQIYAGLAGKMGLGKFFWNDDKELLDFLLKPAGLTFDEFGKVGIVSGSKQYRKYRRAGFNTPSRKIEIYSERLTKWGLEPLPVYWEPPESPLSEPELAGEYPLVMTNHKIAFYQNSRDRMIEPLRKGYPEPLVYIQTETAHKLGIRDGDEVFIENKRGRIKQKAVLLADIDPRVVIVDFGWWYPEKDVQDLHGWAESNINILTSNKPPFARELGSPLLNGTLCKVYKET
jgi:anaerobic selenocysteine-containing dehydrogenase